MPSYVGTWESTQYLKGVVHGDAYAELSDDFTTGRFMLIYRGRYRQGDKSVIQINASRTASQVVPSFKGTYQTQQISFDPNLLTPEEIAGSYTTTGPADKGTFQLRAGTTTEPFEDRRGAWTGCTSM
jgi:hypothetical protein